MCDDRLTDIFYDYFEGNPVLFAEAISCGYEHGNFDKSFSLDSDTIDVYVDANGCLVSVHAWNID